MDLKIAKISRKMTQFFRSVCNGLLQEYKGSLGNYLLQCIGLILLAIGIVCFVRYSVHQGWMSPFAGYKALAGLDVIAATLFISGILAKFPGLRFYSYLLWTFSLLYLPILFGRTYPLFSLIVNPINGAFLVMFFSFIIALWFAQNHRKILKHYERLVPEFLQLGILLTIVWWLHTGIIRSPYHVMILQLGALGVFLCGCYYKSYFLRICSYAMASLALFYGCIVYAANNLVNPARTIQLNVLFGIFVGTFACASLLVRYIRNNPSLNVMKPREEQRLMMILDLVRAFLIFAWIRANIILQFDVLKSQGAMFTKLLMGYSMEEDVLIRQPITNLILSIYYVIFAIILIFISLVRKKPWLRTFGFLIAVAGLLKLGLLLIRQPLSLERLGALVFVGVLLIGASIGYKKVRR